MDALADYADVATRLPAPVDDSQYERVMVMLRDASAVVRSYTNQNFTEQETTDRVRPVGDKIILTQSPVVAVSTVDVIYNGNALPLAGCWIWDGLNEIRILVAGQIINASAEVMDLFQYGTPAVDCTYTHGYATVPDDVVAVVAGMVCRALTAPGMGAFKSQTMGPYSATLADAAIQGIAALTDAEKAILARYRRSARTIELR